MILNEWTRHLEKTFISVHGIKTAIFASPDNGKPVAIFLHGINGDHHGLVPLAHAAQNYRPILVDLVGHGETDIPRNGAADITTIRRWFSQVVDQVAKRYGRPALIVTHSFGCYAAGRDNQIKSVFICPVPTASKFYTQMSRLGDFLFKTRLAVALYNSFPFSVARGVKLLHIRTKQTIDLVVFLSKVSRAATVKQRRYQARLALMSNQEDIFRGIDPDMVIIGLADKVADERTAAQMQKVFRSATINSVPGGHLAPIENADEVFAIIGL